MSGDLDSTRSLRWSIYWLLILTSAALSTARIAAVTGRDGNTPFLSANDRSRWCTIRALVENHTYSIDHLIFYDTGERIPGWHTIDLVRHRDADGEERYFSSKPVLMPTLMAGVYWIVRAVTGATLAEEPFYVGRIVLWICNIPPLVLMGWLLARLVDRLATSDWTRIFTMFAATGGTLLTAFAITLNNHLHAAVCVTIVMYALVRVVNDHDARWRYFLCAGLFSALAFANELPALSLVALVGLGLAILDLRKFAIGFLPPVVIVIAAAAGLNYWAHGSWRPAYTHRSDGPMVEQKQIEDPNAPIEKLLVESPRFDPTCTIVPRLPKNEGDDINDRWNVFNPTSGKRFAVHLDRVSRTLEVREWDNWYEYPETNWQAERKRGVDRGEPSRLVYTFNVLVGHHGLFSLTPLWLIALAGMLHSIYHRDHLRWFAVGVLLLSIVCIGFYCTRPLEDRNYGGWCNGARWLFWFIPCYLIAMLPALDEMSKNKWLRFAATALLLASVFSAWFTPMNPWTHPWIYDYWTYLRWISY